jgi:hypothetical protein
VDTERLTETTERSTDSQVSADSEAGPHRICRVGNLLWKLPESMAQSALEVMSFVAKKQAVREICRALERDSRVVNVIVPDINSDFTRRRTFYPDMNRTSEEALLNGSDTFQVMSLSDPIRFHMHVPKKNQPRWHGLDDIPTEDYFVSWDGVTVFVLWEQDSDLIAPPGGQIVVDILSSALATTQAELYIQACSPGCDNIFFHTNMRLRPDEHYTDDVAPKIVLRRGENTVDVAIPADESNLDILGWLDVYLGLPAFTFARLKNYGRRILDIESSIRDQMAHLLGHYYEHSLITAKPLWRSLKDRWRIRWWRREARQILAGLWLSLANVESLRRDWEESRRNFEGPRAHYMAIFEADYSNDVAAIESLEVGHLDATIEQISGNLDNRALLMATVVGALAGALAGALVGLIH